MEALFEGKPYEHPALDPPPKQSYWFRDVNEAVQFAVRCTGQDLYVGVGLFPRDFGEHHRCVSAEVAGVVGLWADLDLRSDAHPKEPLPATIEEALAILPRQLPPTFVVASGNGAHAWWLFHEPWLFRNAEDRKAAASLVGRWQSCVQFAAASSGWAFDRLPDLARVLRVPGTQNLKDPNNPKPVHIYRRTDCRYDPDIVRHYLDQHGIPDITAQHAAAAADGEPGPDSLAHEKFSITLNAVVPAELLERWITTDPRFKDTRLRQRRDLRDQSQSGYDLALVNFALD